MYPWMVIVARQGRVHEFQMRDRAIAPRDWIVGFHETPDSQTVQNHHFVIESPKGVSVHYCNNEETANTHAKFLAKLNPGHDVFVTRVTGISVSRPSDPTFTKVSEKGVVPE